MGRQTGAQMREPSIEYWPNVPISVGWSPPGQTH